MAKAVPELMGATEAAAELEVTTSNLGRIKDLPKPVQRLSRGDLYRASEIRALARKRKKAKEKAGRA